MRRTAIVALLALGSAPGCEGGLADDPGAPSSSIDAGAAVDEVCTPGTSRSCSLGQDPEASPCSSGTQTCAGEDEFGSWGACVAEPRVSPETCADEIDNDCNGQVDCSDAACLMDPACRAEYCTSGGTWAWPYLYYGCYPTGLAGRGVVDDSGAFWTDVGAFMARCSGRYQVCGRVKPHDGSCTVVEKCADVDLTTGGATIALPRLETWDSYSACALQVHEGGGLVCFVVRGTTADGIAVDREKCIPYGSCGGGPCMGDGCGGGGGTPGGEW